MLPDTLGPMNGPYHLAWDENPAHPRLYIGGEADSGGVIVAEAITCKRLARVSTGPVKALCFVPPHGKLYVAKAGSDTVVVVDCATNQISSIIHTADSVPVMQYNTQNDHLYCGGDQISVIDCAADSMMGMIPVAASAFSYDSAANKLYVGRSGPLAVIDCASDSIVASLPEVGSATALCLNPTARKVYAATTDTLFAIWADGDSVAARLPFDSLKPLLACDPQRNRVYCTGSDRDWGILSSIDCSADTVLKTTITYYPLTFLACNTSRDILYVFFRTAFDEVFMYDATTGQVLTSVRLDGVPPGGGWSPALDRLYCLPFRRIGGDPYSCCLLSAVDGTGDSIGGELPLMDGLEASSPRWNRQGTMVCYSKQDTLTGHLAVYQCHYGLSMPEEQVTDLDEDCENPVYSPNGMYIAFQLDDTTSGFYQLCVTPASGLRAGTEQAARIAVAVTDRTDAVQMPTSVAPVASPAVIEAPKRNDPRLGFVTQVTFALEDHCYPEWSPDGQWLCYERDDQNGYTQIWRVPAFGGTEDQLTFASADHFTPRYLNSYEIVFTLSPDSGDDQIAKVNVYTHEVTILTSWPIDHGNPDPAIDGSSVTSEVLDDSGNSQIVRMAASGGSETWLTSGTYDITEPDYGEDNQTIFAVRWTGSTSQIVWVDAVNGGYTPVTDSLAIRDNPDAHVDTLLSTALAVYEREPWDLQNLLFGRGRRRPGAGVYLSKFRKRHPHEGTQGASLGILVLDKAKPNPATDKVTIRWQVPVESDVSLRVYNAAGQLVKVLADGRTKPGSYTSVWNGTDAKGRRLANGVYFYALDNGTKRINRKVILTE